MEVLSFTHSGTHDELLGGAPWPVNNMLEDFNFDDAFVGFDHEDHVLPDLAEADLGAFSFYGDEEFEKDEENRDSHGNVAERENCEETVSPVEVSAVNSPSPESADKEGGKPKPKPGTHGKGSHGKRKVKVDWKPELHRRFVQAVEQLGIDKAVPSRILEIMGVGGLTRHNVASHLQKYRSHGKHLMAREAEAASWSQRRQTSSSVMHINPRPPVPLHHVPFRPLHVWGHPTWAPPPPPPSTPWQLTPPHCSPRGPNAVAQGTPCFPRPVLPPPPVRFPPALTVVGVPPHPLYGPDGTSAAVPGHPDDEKLRISQIQLLDAPPSKESIDAAIGDAIAKPWRPLPLGLKSPSLESVLAVLCKQGVSIEPPTN